MPQLEQLSDAMSLQGGNIVPQRTPFWASTSLWHTTISINGPILGIIVAVTYVFGLHSSVPRPICVPRNGYTIVLCYFTAPHTIGTGSRLHSSVNESTGHDKRVSIEHQPIHYNHATGPQYKKVRHLRHLRTRAIAITSTPTGITLRVRLLVWR